MESEFDYMAEFTVSTKVLNVVFAVEIVQASSIPMFVIILLNLSAIFALSNKSFFLKIH